MKKSSFVLAALALFVLSALSSDARAQNRPSNPFRVRAEPDAVVTYSNPVIPGFYSDPSVVRVGEDYYLISSTFEYFPAIPIFHSRDLVNWKQIGHVIHRPGQLPEGLNIFACTIRYHNGTFYMITTNNGRGGNFIVTAMDPAGPWSDPIWLEVGGIDPDLYFDDDGKVYTVGSSFDMYELDPNTGELLSEGRKVWASTGGRWAEGPHIYKKDGWYYLMAAEGGTEEAHTQVITRSNDIWGPYYSYPANPILSHVNSAGQGNPIQGVGHADMVNAHDGSWWMVFHGYRSVIRGAVHHTMGRETMLAPVEWPKNAWPQVNGNGTVTVNMTAPTLPLQPFPDEPSRLEFDAQLGLEWNYIQYPRAEDYSLDARPGYLRLKGSELNLGNNSESPTFVGRRQQHMYFMSTTLLEFDPANENEEAGIVLLNNSVYFDLMVRRSDGRRILSARLRFGDVMHESDEFELAPGPVNLRIEGARSTYTFSFAQGSDDFTVVQDVDARFLSSETVGGFSGVYVGLYATGNGRESEANADFDWFEYVENEAPAPSFRRGQ